MTAVMHAKGSVPGRPGLRLGPVSGVWRPRTLGVCAVLTVLILLGGVAQVARGDLDLTVGQVLAIFAGGGDGTERFIVLELRLPRALTGALVGAALGAAGALTQSVLRNPLASPDLLGITAGAAAAAVSLIVLRDASPLSAVSGPAVAVLGGVLTGGGIYMLAWRRGLQGFRVVLVGIGVGAALTSITSWLLVRAELTDATRAIVWLTGSLNARTWDHVIPLAITLAVCTALLLVVSPLVGALRLGEEPARALGVRLQSGQAVVLLTAVVLASVATAAAGPVAFVALVAPQIAVRLVRASGPSLLTSALTGAALVVGADLVARTVLPVELPVGIVTSLIGAPYLLYLLIRKAREVSA